MRLCAPPFFCTCANRVRDRAHLPRNYAIGGGVFYRLDLSADLGCKLEGLCSPMRCIIKGGDVKGVPGS